MQHTKQFVGSDPPAKSEGCSPSCPLNQQKQQPQQAISASCPYCSSASGGASMTGSVGIGLGAGIGGSVGVAAPPPASSNIYSVGVEGGYGQPVYTQAPAYTQAPVYTGGVQPAVQAGYQIPAHQNTAALAYQEVRRQSQARYLSWAKQGGIMALLVVMIYFGFEFLAGRWDPLGVWDKDTTTQHATTTVVSTGGSFSSANGSTGESSSWIGNGDYMYKLNHDLKLIQLGKRPLDANARIQLVEWRSKGYSTIAWAGTDDATLIAVSDQSLLQLLRKTQSELDALHGALDGKYRSRFQSSERDALLRDVREAQQANDQAIGMASAGGGN